MVNKKIVNGVHVACSTTSLNTLKTKCAGKQESLYSLSHIIYDSSSNLYYDINTLQNYGQIWIQVETFVFEQFVISPINKSKTCHSIDNRVQLKKNTVIQLLLTIRKTVQISAGRRVLIRSSFEFMVQSPPYPNGLLLINITFGGSLSGSIHASLCKTFSAGVPQLKWRWYESKTKA